MNYLYQIACALAELSVSLGILLMGSSISFRKRGASNRWYSKATIFLLAITLGIMLLYNSNSIHLETDIFVYNNNSHQLKIFLLLTGVIFSAVLLAGRIFSPILYIVILEVILSLMIVASSGNLIIFFLGLEMYSIGVGLLTIHKTTMAKYMTANAIMAAIFLYGASLYYLNFGTISYGYLPNINMGLTGMIGISFMMFYILFKTNVAPFHTWSIGVYSQSSATLVMFLDSFLKFVLFIILAHFCSMLQSCHITFFRPLLLVAAVLSMIIGGITPFSQDNIKKFIAYSSIGHTGFAVIVFYVFSDVSELKHAVTYVFSYFMASLCFFTGLICIRKHKNVRYISDLVGSVKEFPVYAYTMMFGLTAMVGLPPFINFLAKVNVFKVLLLHGRYDLIAIVSIYTIMTISYTFNIVQEMYANGTARELSKETEKLYSQEIRRGKVLRNVMCVSLVFAVSFSSLFLETIDKYTNQLMQPHDNKHFDRKPSKIASRNLEDLFANDVMNDLYNYFKG
jgi:NADH-quinone oxidoreductase subunit N